jgi:hypothetical protein
MSSRNRRRSFRYLTGNMEWPMSHSGLQNGLVHDLRTDHDMVNEALEKNDMEALEILRETSLDHLQGVMTVGPPETQEGYQAILDIKECIDRIREGLEQKKAEVFSQMMALRKTRHGLKAYKNK